MKVLVTGGSRGIGKAICERFAAGGHQVLAPPREELNLADRASIERYVAAHRDDGITGLVNNAAINPLHLLEDVPPEDYDACLQVNLTAPLFLARGLAPAMKRRGGGTIVNIGSVWGLVSRERRVIYSIAKNGLHGLTNTLAVELGPYGILVNTVCPGFTKTELTAQNLTPEDEAALTEQVPLGRFAQPEEIAKLVYFLGSPENTYITGQKIAIDGGFTAK